MRFIPKQQLARAKQTHAHGRVRPQLLDAAAAKAPIEACDRLDIAFYATEWLQ